MNINKMYKDEIYRSEILSEDKEKALMCLIIAARNDYTDVEVVKAGEEAKKQIVMAHIRLVANIVKHYENYGIDSEDLMSEGILGLYMAIDKYDVQYDNRFSTYAQYYVKNNVQRYIQKNRNIISLDAKLEEDGEERFIDMIPDENCIMPEDALIISERDESIQSILERLDKKSANVLKHHYGFLGERKTLEAIGEIYGLSKERIRQIEASAIKNIRRSPSMMRELEPEF